MMMILPRMRPCLKGCLDCTDKPYHPSSIIHVTNVQFTILQRHQYAQIRLPMSWLRCVIQCPHTVRITGRRRGFIQQDATLTFPRRTTRSSSFLNLLFLVLASVRCHRNNESEGNSEVEECPQKFCCPPTADVTPWSKSRQNPHKKEQNTTQNSKINAKFLQSIVGTRKTRRLDFFRLERLLWE